MGRCIIAHALLTFYFILDDIFSLDLFCAGVLLCIATNVVIHAVLTETKNKSFEEIHADINQNRKIQLCAKFIEKVLNLGKNKDSTTSSKIPGQETVIWDTISSQNGMVISRNYLKEMMIDRQTAYFIND